jgi:hypothetical protein
LKYFPAFPNLHPVGKRDPAICNGFLPPRNDNRKDMGLIGFIPHTEDSEGSKRGEMGYESYFGVNIAAKIVD